MLVNILEAKNRLSQLIKSAQAGEEVIIANRVWCGLYRWLMKPFPPSPEAAANASLLGSNAIRCPLPQDDPRKTSMLISKKRGIPGSNLSR